MLPIFMRHLPLCRTRISRHIRWTLCTIVLLARLRTVRPTSRTLHPLPPSVHLSSAAMERRVGRLLRKGPSQLCVSWCPRWRPVIFSVAEFAHVCRLSWRERVEVIFSPYDIQRRLGSHGSSISWQQCCYMSSACERAVWRRSRASSRGCPFSTSAESWWITPAPCTGS